MPRVKSRYGLRELKERLEEESPGITDSIPSVSGFEFFTDSIQHELYVKVGQASGPMWVRFDDKSCNKMMLFNITSRHPERIIHENKEFARAKTQFSAPFDRLPVLRYEHPGSSFAESLQWFTELKALTMLAFVWCGHCDKFFDFKKGERSRALVEVLQRNPANTFAGKRAGDKDGGSVDKDAEGSSPHVDAECGKGTNVDMNENAGPGAHIISEVEVSEEPVVGANARVTLPASVHTGARQSGPNTIAPKDHTSKKRTLQEFEKSQED